MTNKDYPSLAYKSWDSDSDARWIDAGHTFGIHLMKNVRDSAVHAIPANISAEARASAMEAIRTTIYAVMQLFDGIFVNSIDDEHRAEYVLQMRVRTKQAILETIELAPDGDGLCMAFHGWWKDEFWD